MPTALTVSARYDESRNANVVSLGDGREIWWEVPGVSSLGSMRINDDFAVAAVLPIAMKSGVDIYVDGTVDRQLVISLEKYICAWAQWKPGLYHPVRIRARDIRDFQPVDHATGSIVALSGGVDSTFVMHALRRDARYRLHEIPVASFTIRGFDLHYSRDPVDDPLARAAGKASAYFGLNHFVIRTNWNEHCVDYLLFHPLGIAAVFHQFNAIFRAGYFAADYTYSQDYRVHPKGSSGVTNQFLGSSALHIATVGARFRRTEKTITLLKDQTLKDLIEPCLNRNIATGERCGRCQKCLWLDIVRFHRDRARMTLADEWRLFLRIVRHLRLKGETTLIFSEDAAVFARDDSHLIPLAVKIRKAIYALRKLRRRLVTGKAIKNTLNWLRRDE